MKLTIAENFRAVFYAPFYALRALRLPEREGLEIDWLPGDRPGGAIDDVKRGRIDASFGGPMRVLDDRDKHGAGGTSLVCFGQVVARDPFYLVGRTGQSRFGLKDLAAMRTGIVSEVPTPWHCLRADLVDAGLDPGAMRFEMNLTMPAQLEALKAGRLDVAQLFEPLAGQALEQGFQILYAQAGRGPCVYTTFICSRDSVERRGAEFAALTRALQALLDWLAEKGPAELARVTAPFFLDVPELQLRAAHERYYRAGLWSRHTPISEEGFERLAYSLHSGGLIARRATYAECVHDFSIPA